MSLSEVTAYGSKVPVKSLLAKVQKYLPKSKKLTT